MDTSQLNKAIKKPRNIILTIGAITIAATITFGAPDKIPVDVSDFDPTPVDEGLIDNRTGLDVSYPEHGPEGYLTDYSAILDEDEETAMRALLQDKADQGIEIYVLTIEYARPLTPTGYAKRVQRDWGIENLILMETSVNRAALYSEGSAKRDAFKEITDGDWNEAIIKSIEKFK